MDSNDTGLKSLYPSKLGLHMPSYVKLRMCIVSMRQPFYLLGCIAQSVTCLTTGVCLTADRGVASLILARSQIFVEIDHKIISMVILLPSVFIQEGLLSVTSESMCTKYQLTACPSFLRKKSMVRLIDHPNMTIAVKWDVKQQNKPFLLSFNPCFHFVPF